MTDAIPTRRERKKAATRQSIADAALRLFIEHGYDAVSVRDVAEAADVSTTTLFKHFPGKEALVFDRDTDREAEIVAAVRDRREGEDVLDALQRHAQEVYAAISEHPQADDFAALVRSTPALLTYSDRMWTRHSRSLATSIAAEMGRPADDAACAALARWFLDIPAIIREQPDPLPAIDSIFTLLREGWGSRPI